MYAATSKFCCNINDIKVISNTCRLYIQIIHAIHISTPYPQTNHLITDCILVNTHTHTIQINHKPYTAYTHNQRSSAIKYTNIQVGTSSVLTTPGDSTTCSLQKQVQMHTSWNKQSTQNDFTQSPSPNSNQLNQWHLRAWMSSLTVAESRAFTEQILENALLGTGLACIQGPIVIHFALEQIMTGNSRSTTC